MDKVCNQELGVPIKDIIKDIWFLRMMLFVHFSSQGHYQGHFVPDSQLAFKRHFYRTFSLLRSAIS